VRAAGVVPSIATCVTPRSASQSANASKSGVVVPKLANSSIRLRLPPAAGVRTHARTCA